MKTTVSVNTEYVQLLKACLCASIYPESSWRIVKPIGFLRSKVAWLLDKGNLALAIKEPFDASKRATGSDWPMFGYTMIGNKRLDNIESCVREVVQDDVPGDLIETGAWRGGASIFMRAMLKQLGDTERVVWVCDSFEGLPKPKHSGDGMNLSGAGYFTASLESVQENFARFGLLDEQVRFLKGWFCDTLPGAPIERIAILRLDGDLYHSTMDALNALYWKVSEGGFVIVDDYYSWAGCRRAVDEFRTQQQIHSTLQEVDGHAVFWRV